LSVYVDAPIWGLGRMKMSHMIADTPDELHAMADLLGLDRAWFQHPPRASFWHYDVSQTKRKAAIQLGAIECDRNAFVGHLRRIRESKVFGDLVAISRAAQR
jgi:hypothetical protein